MQTSTYALFSFLSVKFLRLALTFAKEVNIVDMYDLPSFESSF